MLVVAGLVLRSILDSRALITKLRGIFINRLIALAAFLRIVCLA
jgi:hypothetical protein